MSALLAVRLRLDDGHAERRRLSGQTEGVLHLWGFVASRHLRGSSVKA